MSWIPSSAIEELEPIDAKYYSADELKQLGAASVGRDCKISRKVSFHKFCGHFGQHVRIDDWCTIKGDVQFGDFIHIASFAIISGIYATVLIREFCGVSSHLALFSGSDDYNADTLNGPWLPEFVATRTGPVALGIASLIGSHCLILPNVKIGDCASIGSNCTIYEDIPDGGIVRGTKSVLRDKRRNCQVIKEQCLRAYEAAYPGTY